MVNKGHRSRFLRGYFRVGILTPDTGVLGSRLQVESGDPKQGDMEIDLDAVQVLRRLCQHWVTSGNFRSDVVWIADDLLAISDEVYVKLRCPDAKYCAPTGDC